MIISFLLFLTAFALIGISSVRLSRNNRSDYYLASSSVSPALVGLSAVATNNSGYMFIGVIGYTYVTGLASAWLMVGWLVGDFIASTFIHKPLRHATERTGEVSYAGVISQWTGKSMPQLRIVIAVISLIFLLAYASAQLVAGSKALEVIFHWPSWAGALIGAILVGCYCLAGGIRASIWTDAAQSVVMFVAMAALLWVAVAALGGSNAAWQQMAAVDGFLDLFPREQLLPGLAGGILFAIAWAFAGFSVIGQPHIMVRFMTLDNPKNLRRARIWYYLWFSLFYLMATGVGMLSRILLPDTAGFDAELALPTLALQLLPPALTGLVLAGVFAATMSTADSLILSCSSALTHDLRPGRQVSMRTIKTGTLIITLAALGWALSNQQTVFELVILSWSGLGSALSPLLIVLALGARPSQRHALLAVITGLAVALGWRFLGLHALVYEGMPGLLAGLLILLPALLRRTVPVPTEIPAQSEKSLSPTAVND